VAVAVAIDVDRYQPHWLHGDSVDWPETNCYVDVVLELLAALGHDPLPALGFTIRTDLEADQFTFFKFRHTDLESLYGFEIVETNPWTDVVDQVTAEVRSGRVPLVEVDSFFLPDTVGTAYGSAHVKTTIAVLEIHTGPASLVYAHNRSIHRVAGADAQGLLAAANASSPVLPPYLETVRIDRPAVVDRAGQHGFAREQLRHHVVRMPETNPFVRFQDRFDADLDRLSSGGMEFFHNYAFAMFRQFGASASLAAAHLDWLASDAEPAAAALLSDAADCFRVISQGARTLQLRCARTAMSGKRGDVSATFASLQSSWETASANLRKATDQ
jgi:Domain of unknown function (DUF1839)